MTEYVSNQIPGQGPTSSTSMSRSRRRFYTLVGLLIALWATGLLAIALTVIPDLYWFSYYAVDYRLGFVRRGLAGELATLFGEGRYFSGLRILRWAPTIFYAGGLALTAWVVAKRSGHSERRIMLAILIPVLPFGFAFALFSARPDLFGAAAFLGFAAALKCSDKDHSVVIASAVYGLATAIITLTHEASPLLFALGVLAALAVLARHRPEKTLRLSAILALLPGLLTVMAVALLGRRGISAEVCESIPHGTVNWPASGKPSFAEVVRGYRFDIDYHEWICRNIAPLYDQGLWDAARFVADIGLLLLTAATVIGVVLATTTILAISHVSGVPFSRMRALLSGRILWMIVGVGCIIPIFATGVDWIRWWVVIAFDVGIVFLLFTSGEPEVDQPPTRRTLIAFALGVALLALFPLGVLPGFGAPVPM